MKKKAPKMVHPFHQAGAPAHNPRPAIKNNRPNTRTDQEHLPHKCMPQARWCSFSANSIPPFFRPKTAENNTDSTLIKIPPGHFSPKTAPNFKRLRTTFHTTKSSLFCLWQKKPGEKITAFPRFPILARNSNNVRMRPFWAKTRIGKPKWAHFCASKNRVFATAKKAGPVV